MSDNFDYLAYLRNNPLLKEVDDFDEDAFRDAQDMQDTSYEQIAIEAGNYVAAVTALEDHGLSRATALAIANEVYPEDDDLNESGDGKIE